MFCFVNINTTKRHPLSRMPFMLPGMSGWRSLNQANRNGRTRTFDTLALRSTALPLSYVPRERQQAFACCLVGFDASRRPYAFGFMVHYNTSNRDMCDIWDKIILYLHKPLILFLYAQLCRLTSHSLCDFFPGKLFKDLIPDNPLHSLRYRVQPCFHIMFDPFRNL